MGEVITQRKYEPAGIEPPTLQLKGDRWSTEQT